MTRPFRPPRGTSRAESLALKSLSKQESTATSTSSSAVAESVLQQQITALSSQIAALQKRVSALEGDTSMASGGSLYSIPDGTSVTVPAGANLLVADDGLLIAGELILLGNLVEV